MEKVQGHIPARFDMIIRAKLVIVIKKISLNLLGITYLIGLIRLLLTGN